MAHTRSECLCRTPALQGYLDLLDALRVPSGMSQRLREFPADFYDL